MIKTEGLKIKEIQPKLGSEFEIKEYLRRNNGMYLHKLEPNLVLFKYAEATKADSNEDFPKVSLEYLLEEIELVFDSKADLL